MAKTKNSLSRREQLLILIFTSIASGLFSFLFSEGIKDLTAITKIALLAFLASGILLIIKGAVNSSKNENNKPMGAGLFLFMCIVPLLLFGTSAPPGEKGNSRTLMNQAFKKAKQQYQVGIAPVEGLESLIEPTVAYLDYHLATINPTTSAMKLASPVGLTGGIGKDAERDWQLITDNGLHKGIALFGTYTENVLYPGYSLIGYSKDELSYYDKRLDAHFCNPVSQEDIKIVLADKKEAIGPFICTGTFLMGRIWEQQGNFLDALECFAYVRDEDCAPGSLLRFYSQYFHLMLFSTKLDSAQRKALGNWDDIQLAEQGIHTFESLPEYRKSLQSKILYENLRRYRDLRKKGAKMTRPVKPKPVGNLASVIQELQTDTLKVEIESYTETPVTPQPFPQEKIQQGPITKITPKPVRLGTKLDPTSSSVCSNTEIHDFIYEYWDQHAGEYQHFEVLENVASRIGKPVKNPSKYLGITSLKMNSERKKLVLGHNSAYVLDIKISLIACIDGFPRIIKQKVFSSLANTDGFLNKSSLTVPVGITSIQVQGMMIQYDVIKKRPKFRTKKPSRYKH